MDFANHRLLYMISIYNSLYEHKYIEVFSTQVGNFIKLLMYVSQTLFKYYDF